MQIIEEREFPGLAKLYLAQLGSNPENLVEFVDTLEPGVPKSRKWVMMISTQFGCPVGCRMCDAGALGYRGNLSAEEILGQVRKVVSENGDLNICSHPKVKVHFARMGEPSLNPNVLSALRMLANEYPHDGILPSISTVAPKTPIVEAFFEELREIKNAYFAGGRFQVQFSVHSLDEEKRRRMVPIKKWSLEEMAAYGDRFLESGDRKITLNFALTQEEEIEARKLKRIFSPEKFLIKITPINPTEVANRNGVTRPWGKVPGSVQACADGLRSEGFEVVLSPSLPEEISAATSCGQVWSENLGARAHVVVRNQLKEMDCYISTENLFRRSRAWMKELAKLQRNQIFPAPHRLGLVVVDMQDFFLNPYSPAYLPPARVILENVRRLVDAFRRLGRPVYFAFHGHKDPTRDGGMMTVWWKKVCLEGTPHSRITPLLGPEKERIFRKCRYSAFSNPEMERTLRRDGITDLAVAGLATHLCVESTVRDAFDRGFKTFIPSDATAAQTEELHLSALKTLAHGFSMVVLTGDFIERIKSNGLAGKIIHARKK
ncbi:MAG: isochorismatase family protein [Elusimicrobia bacterium]|nr:isochorismatase family protein [Elusimicrobiota bacterium]